MKIIIAGDGKVGIALTRQFTAEGHDVTVIDYNSTVLDASVERYDVISVEGNCASMAVLSQAGVKEAELLIAVTNHDEINLLCCTTAHSMNPRLHTIARIRSTTSRHTACGTYSAFPWSSIPKTRPLRRSTGC